MGASSTFVVPRSAPETSSNTSTRVRSKPENSEARTPSIAMSPLYVRGSCRIRGLDNIELGLSIQFTCAWSKALLQSEQVARSKFLGF